MTLNNTGPQKIYFDELNKKYPKTVWFDIHECRIVKENKEGTKIQIKFEEEPKCQK